MKIEIGENGLNTDDQGGGPGTGGSLANSDKLTNLESGLGKWWYKNLGFWRTFFIDDPNYYCLHGKLLETKFAHLKIKNMAH